MGPVAKDGWRGPTGGESYPDEWAAPGPALARWLQRHVRQAEQRQLCGRRTDFHRLPAPDFAGTAAGARGWLRSRAGRIFHHRIRGIQLDEQRQVPSLSKGGGNVVAPALECPARLRTHRTHCGDCVRRIDNILLLPLSRRRAPTARRGGTAGGACRQSAVDFCMVGNHTRPDCIAAVDWPGLGREVQQRK